MFIQVRFINLKCLVGVKNLKFKIFLITLYYFTDKVQVLKGWYRKFFECLFILVCKRDVNIGFIKKIKVLCMSF